MNKHIAAFEKIFVCRDAVTKHTNISVEIEDARQAIALQVYKMIKPSIIEILRETAAEEMSAFTTQCIREAGYLINKKWPGLLSEIEKNIKEFIRLEVLTMTQKSLEVDNERTP